MSNVALTNIRYGLEDGTIVEVPHGSSVDALPQDVIDSLTADGLIGPGVENGVEDKVEDEVDEVDEVDDKEEVVE